MLTGLCSGLIATLAFEPSNAGLGYLQIDLSDPDFHRHVKAQAQAARRGIRDLLDAAVAARELAVATDTAGLARTVEAVVGGSLFAWAFHRAGRARDWVRQDLDAVLRPYLARRGRRRRRVPRRTARE